MSSVENEVGLHGAGLENGLRDGKIGDLDGCRLSCPKKHCRAKVGEHDLERQIRWSRGGRLCLESRLGVGLKVLVCRQKGQVVLDVHDHLEVQLVDLSPLPGV